VFGTRTEVKNMNSFHAVYQALEFEVERQKRVIADGDAVVQETRGWIEEREVTVSQRSKEYAHDYRYFPEPDLPPLRIGPERVAQLKAALPELAPQRKSRFQSELGLSEYDAELLVGSRAMADYFEATVALRNATAVDRPAVAKEAANWMLGDLARLLNQDHLDIDASPVTPERLNDLLTLIDDGTLSTSLAKTVLDEMYASGGDPADIVQAQGLGQISDTGAIEDAVAEAIAANPKAVADYISGKDTAARFLMGQVMRLTRGQAQPELALRLVQEGLEGEKARLDG
jgi:aspartyl-tRNA(Asn)/glutamyl-tRNA(Gln) amidotransferase subunit B